MMSDFLGNYAYQGNLLLLYFSPCSKPIEIRIAMDKDQHLENKSMGGITIP